MIDIAPERPLYIHHAGPALLTTPLLNKGSAFSKAERIAFNLHGLLPPRYETIEEQAARCYRQFLSFDTPLNRHIYLRAIQDKNETLFYKLVQDHLEEMMPIIYTPTVGEACERFSDIYRSSRGLFIAYPEREHLDDILHNATKRNVKVIVVTDGERILGLGDQGIGGMGIPIGKLTLYTVCGGISPAYTLPIMLDVGTNNQTLLNDPMYMGWRHPRIGEAEYAEFMDLFMDALRRRWPQCMVQFEDFAQAHAMPLLERYRHRTCCFNDDIQGTAAVALGSLLAACRVKGESLTEQIFIFAGAGSAGCGIAEYVVRQLCAEGLTEAHARARIFMVDKCGVLTSATEGLRDFQARLAQPLTVLNDLQLLPEERDLAAVINRTRATVLIGVSGQPGLFTEPAVAALCVNTQRPIIFPLSNPSKRIEAAPEDVIHWSQGRAIVATGSPFDDVRYDALHYPIAQCNNSYIFPGVGLAVVAAGIRRITDSMMLRASHVLAEHSPAARGAGLSLLPPLTEIASLSRTMAFAIAKLAQAEGHALEMPDELLANKIARAFWTPHYRAYRRASV